MSKNVIDAKASSVLAKALKNNSNLKELDLSENRMKNAGIALISEIFILQQAQKFQRKQDKDQMKKLAASTGGKERTKQTSSSGADKKPEADDKDNEQDEGDKDQLIK